MRMLHSLVKWAFIRLAAPLSRAYIHGGPRRYPSGDGPPPAKEMRCCAVSVSVQRGAINTDTMKQDGVPESQIYHLSIS